MQVQAQVCGDCGTHLATALKVCPGCGLLLHRAELERLRQSVRDHRAQGALSNALLDLRRMLELLPSGSKQYLAVQSQLAELSHAVAAQGAKPVAAGGATGATAQNKDSAGAPRGVAALSGLGFLLWKAKWLFAALLGKGKFLLLGLTKLKTLLTMFVSLGAYWAIWGWRFALGAVLSMYVHEMGHVSALSRFGVRASAPMFVPGLGAMVRLEQRLASPVEEARVGLAGPVWGGAAALLCFGIYRGFDAPLFGALAGFGAWLNLFNLIPMWQLDGSRAFGALSGRQRLFCALVGLVCAGWTGDVMLYALTGVAFLQAYKPTDARAPADTTTAGQYVLLLALLSFMVAATQRVRAGLS